MNPRLASSTGTVRVALVNTSTIQWGSLSKIEPVGLCYLAGSLGAAGYPVSIFDFEVQLERQSYQALVDAICQYPIVGVAYYCQLEPNKHVVRGSLPIVSTLHFIRELKARNPSVVIVVGGPGASSSDEWLLRECGAIDYVLRGEAETSLVSLMEAILGTRPFVSVPGLSYRLNGRLIRIPLKQEQVELNSLPPPRRDLLACPERYRPTIVSSRGCPHQCMFCQPLGESHRWRSRSPRDVVDEIEDVHTNTGHIVSEPSQTSSANGGYAYCSQRLPGQIFWRMI